MASWLKAAEDLFEVVDRRAKLVVGEKPDELPDVQTLASLSHYEASNGQGSPTKRVRPRAKSKKRLANKEAPVDVAREKTSPETTQKHVVPKVDIPMPSIENNESNSVIPRHTVNDEEKGNVDGDGSITEPSLSSTISNDEAKPIADHLNAASVANVELVPSNSNDEIGSEDPSGVPLGAPSGASKGAEIVQGISPTDSSQNIISEDAGSFKNLEQVESQSLHANGPSKVDAQSAHVDLVVERNSEQKKHQEQKNVSSAMKVQEQLDEAQGLLSSAISTGQSKEARLARVCAGLQSRLQEYKSENSQLEELLTAERELSKSYEARIKQLQKDLSVSKNEVTRVESNMVEALAAKNAEIEALVSSVDALKKQAALSEENLASLQANTESLMRNRELTETRMMQALREELSSTERRAEDERAAHNATKMAAREREVDLEHRALEASTALARIQRTADERAAKAAELEQKVVLLEVECASLNQELQDMEARVRREQKKSPEDANQAIQVQAWQEEVERARQGQREAENKLSSMEAEVQKMRVEMAAMRRDAEHYSRQEHMELEKRYRELTDLLYYKQTQLETMASEKAAAEFQLEKEVKRLQEAQLEAERSRASRRASSSWEEDSDMKTLEPLPLHHRHMAGASLQLQKAAKLLDTGAVRATRFLWRYPTARLILLFYLVFVHLFLMYLLHRLQEQADTFSSREVAESMGLANQMLP